MDPMNGYFSPINRLESVNGIQFSLCGTPTNLIFAHRDASSTLLLLFYSFISFSRRAKTNIFGIISHLRMGLFLVTCSLNTEMTSWYTCVGFECMLLCFLQRVPIVQWFSNLIVP